jgi:hypothetical protein
VSYNKYSTHLVIASEENGGRAGHQKIVGSIPSFIGFSCCAMALGSTQSLTVISTRNCPESKGWPVRKADNLKAMC